MARTPRVGPVTFFQLLSRFGTAAKALDFLEGSFQRKGSGRIAPRMEIETEIERLEAFGARLVCASERDFPALLKQLTPPPPVLACKGSLELGAKPAVAIVGARQASALGRKIARDISMELSQAGFVVVSGLARGIDGEAHAASLSSGTIAVLGGGIDHIYPRQHEQLYNEIAERGLILSENPIGYRATSRDFPRRNRIVTGLSAGVIVIEAAERSGSLISARTAAEQNRDVFAVPGSPLDDRYAGSNRLIRDGAILARHADDVIEVLSQTTMSFAKAPDPLSYEEEDVSAGEIPRAQIAAVVAALSPSPVSIEEIARAAEIGAGRCAAILVELEIEGRARTYAGGLASQNFD